MDIDFDLLAKETMYLAPTLGQQDRFHLDNTSVKDELIYPSGSGLIYFIEKGISTFCIRGIESENIACDYEQIKIGNKILFNQDKLSSFNELKYFELPYFEIAEVVKEQLFNRRFPIKEDELFNISDPGLSWWLSFENNSLKIYFRSHGIDRNQNLLCLGPIGDLAIFQNRFSELLKYMRTLFSLENFELNNISLGLTCLNPENKNFKDLYSLFKNGATEFASTILECDEVLGLFLYELAYTRRFWEYATKKA